MNKKQKRSLSLLIGLILGALADIWLRLVSGDEGNLLVHSVVFLGAGLISAGIVYGLLSLWDLWLNRK